MEQFLLSAEEGDVESLKAGIASGIDVNVADDDGYSALHLATKGNHLDAISFLLEAGATVDKTTFGETIKTPLHIASHRGYVEAMRLLLDAGADPNLEGTNEHDYFLPLHRAAIECHLEGIDLLLERGAKIDAVESGGQITALGLSAFALVSRSVRLLLERGANPNAQDDVGVTPLMEAAIVGATAICQLLVEVGKADLTLRSNAGATALDEAIRHEMWESAQYLWDHGCEASITRGKNGIKGSTWVRPYFLNHLPARYSHGLAINGNRLYCFGGNGILLENDKIFPYNPDMQIPCEDLILSDLWTLQLDQCELLDIRKLPQQICHIIPVDGPGDKETDKASKRSKTKTKTVPSYQALLNPSLNTLDETTLGEHLFFGGNSLTLCREDEEGPESPDQDVASNARAAFSFNKTDHHFGYFETTVLKLDVNGCLAVGLVSETVKNEGLPGWKETSFGLHSDDARAFNSTSFGTIWGRRYHVGDTVGCGINFDTQEVFFTLNGAFLGVAYRGFKETRFWACVGFRSTSAIAQVNFGATPFMFDFEIPVLRWERLPSSFGSNFRGTPHHLIPYRDSVLLFTSPTRDQLAHFYDHRVGDWVEIRANSPITLGPSTWRQKTTFIPIGDIIYGCVAWTEEDMIVFKIENIDLENQTCDWSTVLPLPSSCTVTTETHAKETLETLRSFATAPCIPREGKLCFFSTKQIATFDPVSYSFHLSNFRGSTPVSTQMSLNEIHGHVAAFGGWDANTQRNDLLWFDPKNLLWYQNHMSGVSPRARSFHATASITLPKDHLLISRQANIQNSTSTVQACVILGGWSGHAHLSDIELLIPNRTDLNQDDTSVLSWDATSETAERLKVKFKVTSPDGSQTAEFAAYSIIVSSRSSILRNLLASENVKEIEVKDAHPSHWKRLLQFFADDQVDFEYDHDEARIFYKLVKKWCPEHGERICEALLMNILYQKSSFAENLDLAFDNSSFSDIDLIIDGKTIKSHRCILSRNPYFRQLFSSGMIDARSSSIYIPNCSYRLGSALIRFIYTRNIDLDSYIDDMAELFQLSDMYRVEELKSLLESVLCFNLTESNVVSILSLASAHNSLKTRQACMDFIQKHAEVQQTEEFRLALASLGETAI